MITDFSKYSDEERLRLLIDNCYRTEEDFRVKKYFTVEEIAQFKDQLTALCVSIKGKEDLKKKLTQEINAELKPLVLNRNEITDFVKDGFTEEKQDVYLFDDQEAGVMYYYDATGAVVMSRKLFPHERQTKIQSLMQAS